MRALEREKEQFSFHVAGSVRHSEPLRPAQGKLSEESGLSSGARSFALLRMTGLTVSDPGDPIPRQLPHQPP